MQKKVVRYFRNFEDEHDLWLTFAIFASDRRNTTHGVATIVPLSESVWGGPIQTNHVVTAGGATGAMAKAVAHLDSIYGDGDEGLEKLEDDI
jgi:hypothetical protein